MRVLITGSSGYLGSKIVSILSNYPSPLPARQLCGGMGEGEGGGGSHEVFGIDIKSPRGENLYKNFIMASVTDKNAMERIFALSKPDAAIHLAFVVNPLHKKKEEKEVAIEGTKHFLSGCERHNVKKVVFMSSAAAYGAHPDSVLPFTEDSPVRGNKSYLYSHLKAQTDKMAQDYMQRHHECLFTILRPCLFVGPNTANSFFEALKFPFVPQIMDVNGLADPQFQFIHEDDMAGCVAQCINENARGVFNVAADGVLKFSEIAEMAGKRRIAVPFWILYFLVSLLWSLHLVSAPPGQLNFMRYSWVVNNAKMKRELFHPKYSSRKAFEEFACQGKF